MKKILRWSVVGVMSLGGIAACSSDKKSPATTDAPATGDSTAASTGGSNSAAVDKFCADVADLVAKGPTDPGFAAGIAKLTSDGTALGVANPADEAKIADCIKKLVPGG